MIRSFPGADINSSLSTNYFPNERFSPLAVSGINTDAILECLKDNAIESIIEFDKG